MRNFAITVALLLASCQGNNNGHQTTAQSRTSPAASPSEESKYVGEFKALVAAYEAVDRFSGVVLVQQKGKTIFEANVGYANRELNVLVTQDSLFRIGSVTKQFTAAAIMKLVEQGKCKVEDKLSLYVPDYEPGKVITIHQLLTHTAGVPNFTDFPSYRSVMGKHHSLSQIIDIFRKKPLEFTPGSRFKYSNSGYVLLTAVVEKASGMEYEAFMKKEIWSPAALTSTRYDRGRPIIKNRAAGYQMGPGKKLVNASHIDMSVPAGAGGVLSTARDLCRWDRALHDGRVLSEASRKKMFTPDKGSYGYGWRISNLHGTPMILHGGGVNGFVSHFMRFPSKNLCIVVLANHTFARPGMMALGLANIWFGKPAYIPRIKKAVMLPLAQLQAVTGTYQIKGLSLTATIFIRGGDLYAQIKGQRAFRLFPEAPHRFFIKEVDVDFTFVVEGGRAVSMNSFQNGRNTLWLRKAAPVKTK
ncbi:beta-lactamase family protein [Myxococcota bacterium]|nr:beta-lactamase family protein [Myxococcota bacterium]MBU1535782.1 beta-lactamase family protein [Myxococcota bacterium]